MKISPVALGTLPIDSETAIGLVGAARPYENPGTLRGVRFSKRTEWNTPINGLTLARQSRTERGLPTLDLTESNPTAIGLDYPTEELGAIFAEAAKEPYEPHPAGLVSAREALASSLSENGAQVSPDDLILTSSTSEGYTFLFKLLTDAGDNVLAASPGYPLFDHLAALESVELRRFPLELDLRWVLHGEAAISVMSERTRAIAVVHPNNPTGSFLRIEEQDSLAEICAGREAALISDEVFLDYPLIADSRRAGPAADRRDVLSFSLGGLSKSAGMPHFKLGWIRIGGPEAERRRAIAALELIADSFLSVATPVQQALPDLLRIAPSIRRQISARITGNLETLRAALGPLAHVRVLEPEGGWSVLIRIPRTASDEDLALELLEETSVLVHPGYFFDFASEGWFVISLLPHPDTFAEGARLLAKYLRDSL